MPVSCAAYGCTLRFEKGSEISFHRFPIHREDMLKKWIASIRRKNWSPSKYKYLCSKHFRKEDFIPTLKGKRYLKSNAVPSVFDFPQSLLKLNCRDAVMDQDTVTDPSVAMSSKKTTDTNSLQDQGSASEHQTIQTVHKFAATSRAKPASLHLENTGSSDLEPCILNKELPLIDESSMVLEKETANQVASNKTMDAKSLSEQNSLDGGSDSKHQTIRTVHKVTATSRAKPASLHLEDTLSSTLEPCALNKELPIIYESNKRKATKQVASLPIMKKRKKSLPACEQSSEMEQVDSLRKKKKSNAASKKEKDALLKEEKLRQQKEKLQQEKEELEAVILRLQLTKLLLEMEKISEERERISVERRNIALRFEILSLRTQLSDFPIPASRIQCSSNANNNNNNLNSKSVYVPGARLETLQSSSKNLHILQDQTIELASLNTILKSKFSHLESNVKESGKQASVELLTDTTPALRARKKFPVLYLCSTDPNMQGNLSIATPFQVGKAKKGIVLSRKLATKQTVVGPAASLEHQSSSVTIPQHLKQQNQPLYKMNSEAQTASFISKSLEGPLTAKGNDYSKLGESFVHPVSNVWENENISKACDNVPFTHKLSWEQITSGTRPAVRESVTDGDLLNKSKSKSKKDTRSIQKYLYSDHRISWSERK